jgi:transcriptional antiterminator RfaH
VPLFRGYIFVRVIEQWRSLDRTLGVLGLIKFGDAPAHCPNAEVEALLARADSGGVIRLPPRPPAAPTRTFAPGARVKISDGPFKGFAGLYAGMSRRDRELVLIDLLGRKTTVEIAAASLVAAE